MLNWIIKASLHNRVLVLMADVASEHPAEDVALVMGELERYSPALIERPRLLVLSKADLLPAEDHATATARAGMPDALLISAHSGVGLNVLLERLWAILDPVGAPKEAED